MNGRWANTVAALVLSAGLVGCSTVSDQLSNLTGRVSGFVGDDLTRTSEMAGKYDKPEVKLCADFLITALNSEDGRLASLDELLKEPTSGLLSLALKNALIADYVRSVGDPLKQTQFKADFDRNCNAVAGQMIINIARDSRKVAGKRIGL